MSSDQGISIAFNPLGGVYITGTFASTMDFDPDSGTSILNPNGNHNDFLAKYDFAGNYQWAFSMESGINIYGRYSVAKIE